ncbi:dpy-1, partial [Pristionchus pacificus]
FQSKMRIELHAGWRRALLLLAILPSLTSAQAGYDFETQPISPSFSPRGYQPPPQPARYPVPAPAPRFRPHQSVGYQPPPQPALYESTAEYRQPSRPVYRPHLPHRPAPESTYEATPVQHRPHRPQYETAPERPAYHPEPEEQPSYGATPVQPMYPRQPPPIPPHRPSTAHPYTYGPEPARPSYESTPRQPMRAASMMPPAPHRPAPVYDLEPARPSPSPRPTQRPAPAYESVPDHPAPAYHPEPSRPAPSPRPTQRPAHAYHPEPARPSPSPRPTERPAPAYHPEPENPYESVPAPPPHRTSPSHRPEPANPYEPEPNPYEPAPHHPVQRPGQTRQPPAIAPSGTFGPAPGSENSEGEGLNVMIHVFINEKQPAGVTTEAPGPMAPPQPLPPQLAGMHFPHSSMPLTFTRDFDRMKNRFLMDEEEDNQEGPANIVEIKAVVDSSDAAMDMRIGKAMAKELDRAVPAILGKIADKTSRLDVELRNMLEQELISEISKNLGAHLEQSTDVSEKELSDLIDEGLKELEPDTTPSRPHFTAPPSSPATSRPAATSKPATQPPTRPTEATRPSEHPAPHTTESDQPTRPTETARPPASHTTAQPVPPTLPAAPATEVTSSPPAVTSQPAQPPATTASATRPSEPPAKSSSPAASPATSTAAETHRPDTVATSRPVQQQQSTAAAPSPATVQWWTPTTAAPPAADAAEPQHPTAATTAAPLPPVATMRTFPTETLPLPVTQPTLKVPESEEEKSEDVDEMPFHHKGDEFPTEQPARPMHESTSTTQFTQPTTIPGTKPATAVPGTKPAGTTEATPGTKPTTHETTVPGTKPAVPSATETAQPAVPEFSHDSSEATTHPSSATTTPDKVTEASKPTGTTEASSETKEATLVTKPSETTTEPTEGSNETTELTPATTQSSGSTEPPVPRKPISTLPPIVKTASEEAADDLSLDDLIAAIEDDLNEEEMKKPDESKEKSAEETTTTAVHTVTEESTIEKAPETTTQPIATSSTKSELEKELEHELSKELAETSELADELSKTLDKELSSTEKSMETTELVDEVSKTLNKELLSSTEKSQETTELVDEVSETLNKELLSSTEKSQETADLDDELSKTLSKELLKSEETELEKALSTELEKNIEEGKSIETLIHEGEKAFEKLEKENMTEKQGPGNKPEPGTKPEMNPEVELSKEEMPFEGKDAFGMEMKANDTVKPKEEEKAPTSECSVARDASDTTKADVLFLLDSSTVFNESNFKGALELITNTTSHFKNIGQDGIQVSLIQFADEPQLEFSLRRHNCLPTLIEDIKGTEYLKGKSLLGHAIDKATRLAFTRERGDRPDAENVLIVVTDGISEDKVHLPVTVAKENGVSVLVISTIEADPEIVLELAGTAENVFKMDGKITEPLSTRLAQRIRDTASGYHIPEQRFPPDVHESKDESAEEKKKEEKGGEKPKDESTSTVLPSTLMSGEVTQEMLPPPKNLKLACTRKSLGINIELPGAFHGWLFIEGQRENKNCSMKVEKEEGVPFRHVHFEAGIEECDIAHIVSESPAGVNSSAVVSIVKHPKAVSIDDKAYLLECFVASALETTLDAHLEVVGGIKKTIAEAFSLDVVPPKCHYTIRKGSPEGVEVEKADLGEVVFHRWDCDGGDEAYDVFGMHIHDCYASSDVEQQFPILDKNGCSSNLNLLNTPVYAEGALSVYAESRAFAVENDQQDLKFQCKVSLCTRDGDGCEGITPPHCSGNNATDLLVSRRLRHNQAVDSALTSAVATSVGLTTAAVSRYSPGLVVLIAIILAVAIGLISAVRLKSCRTRRSCSRPIVTSPSMEEIYVTVPGARPPIRTPGAPNPAMTDFMKNFDRSRYV